MSNNEERDDHDDGAILDVQAQRQRDRLNRSGSATAIYFHHSPPDGMAPFVTIFVHGKFHHRRPGAPSVGRALLAALNAVGAVHGGPGR